LTAKPQSEVGNPDVVAAFISVPATFEHAFEIDNCVALLQSSLDNCALIAPEMKIKKSRKEDWYNGFCIEKDLDKLKQL
jgi:hypothetical protein